VTGAALTVLAFTGWAVLLAIVNATWRPFLVLTGQRAAHDFPQSKRDDEELDFTYRLTRAHMNTLENLPIFLALMWLCDRVNANMNDATLAGVVIVLARVGQTVTHLIRAKGRFVHVRYTFFLVQVCCYVWLIVTIVDRF